MLGDALDIFRMRQYFNVVTRTREWVGGVREDRGFLDDLRRALVMLPWERGPAADLPVFPSAERLAARIDRDRRLALVATGGSGALASLVGVARALEEAERQPSVISVCSGSSLFGFPLGAGVPAEEVAAFTLSLHPEDYVDVDWRRLAAIVPTLGRGFAGILTGEAIERTFRGLVGDMTLGEMPIPTYAPIWNIEENRVEYLGPRTYPDVTVARAVRMAIALPLFIAPVELGNYFWCDGGIVDIFPVHPVLDIEPVCDFALAVNGFYPPAFVGENAAGWQERPVSILQVASQVRTAQQVELARENLARLRASCEVAMLEPVPYERVRGVGFYREFLSTRDWASFMRSGRVEARRALAARPARANTPDSAVPVHPTTADLPGRGSEPVVGNGSVDAGTEESVDGTFDIEVAWAREG
ncbi:MAG: patatin-like phospholipase family protein [Acidimicrobiia bacterium]